MIDQAGELFLQAAGSKQPAADEEPPERLLACLLKGENEANLQRREQPQALCGLPDALQRQPAGEEGLHLELREITPAPADFAKPLALATLENECLDESRKSDDAGVIQKFAETQLPPGDSGYRSVVSRALRRCAARRGALRPGALWRPLSGPALAGAGSAGGRRFAVDNAASEKFPKQSIGTTGLDEPLAVPNLGRPVGRPVRVGLEGFQTPGGPETRLLNVFEECRVQPGAEEEATGLEEFVPACLAHRSLS